jgi:hypothetical protein
LWIQVSGDDDGGSVNWFVEDLVSLGDGWNNIFVFGQIDVGFLFLLLLYR